MAYKSDLRYGQVCLWGELSGEKCILHILTLLSCEIATWTRRDRPNCGTMVYRDSTKSQKFSKTMRRSRIATVERLFPTMLSFSLIQVIPSELPWRHPLWGPSLTFPSSWDHAFDPSNFASCLPPRAISWGGATTPTDYHLWLPAHYSD